VTTVVAVPAAVGEPEPLERLFDEHYGSLVGLARLLLDDGDAAEEVVQEAFARLAVGRSRLRDPDRAPAYLRSTVVNLARGRLRRRAVARRHPEPAPVPVGGADEFAVRADARRRVLDAVRSLPRRQREVLVLRYYLDLSEREIADSLGISAGSVKTHASRGLAALGPVLEALR
jgi:RNA polymerase sigma-70 factor (sigma-E family)